jgi:formate hydrogenlyase transcriptional activator
MSSALELLPQIVEALSRSHTERTCVEALFGVLGRPWQATSVELAMLHGNVFTVGSHECRVTSPTEAERAWVERAANGPVHVGQGARLVIPVRLGNAALACLTFVLGPLDAGSRGAMTSTDPELPLLGHVVGAALQHVRDLERVARLSRRAIAESRQLRDDLDARTPAPFVVASSPAMRRIFAEVVPAVARQSTTVLLLGESGTGKEVVARRIHDLSPRARRAFVRINCGAIPSELVESTLFGHERGAFTGALARRIGAFERASGGTLLLDEIGDLPLQAQVKLLRALESGEIERVGGEHPVRVDVRVIASTHRDLRRMVDAQAFRADLRFRLDVFPIVLPPLRERGDDLEALALQILERLAARFGRAAPRLGRTTRARLRRYPWPGNVRELENVLERSLLLSPGPRLELALPEAAESVPVQTLRAAERQCIERALAAARGRIHGPEGAATLLAMKPTTLQSAMKRLGVTRPTRTRV